VEEDDMSFVYSTLKKSLKQCGVPGLKKSAYSSTKKYGRRGHWVVL